MGKRQRNHGTPATVQLQAAGVDFEALTYEHDPRSVSYGMEAAEALGLKPAHVFKTLVAATDLHENHGLVIAIIPVDQHLSLKALATAVGAKRATMADKTVVERTTGYVVGGVSPFGQKRQLVTVVDATAKLLPRIAVSGGKRGFDLLVAPADLIHILHARVADLLA